MQPENLSDPSDTEEIIVAQIADESHVASETSRQSFIEQLLSPQTLQWMMACGSGLLMLGLVIWLWSVGVFENPIVVAVSAGTATLSLLCGGMAMCLKTRHQLAGRWLTILGAVALPLNLWLYDAQGLITLAEGGHLWIPAAMCCVIYAGVARVLRDASFVYAIVGGIVLTGMLFLADHSVGRFWEWLPPAKFLILIGWMSVFAERLFANENIDSGNAKKVKADFSRSNFGAAFFRAGMIVVGCGITLIAGGFASVIANSVLGQIDSFWSLTSVTANEKQWALGMVAASAIGMSVQGFLRKSPIFYVAAMGLVAMAAAITLNLLAIPVTGTLLASLIATLVFGANIIEAASYSKGDKNQNAWGPKLPLAWSQVAVVGLLALTVFQVVAYLCGVSATFIKPLSWWSVLQYSLTAAASWSLAWNSRERAMWSNVRTESAGAFAVIAAMLMMVAVWTAVWIQNAFPMQIMVQVVSAIPVITGFVGLVFSKTSRRKSLASNAASAMNVVHLGLVAASSFGGLVVTTNIMWVTILGVAAVAFFVASRIDARELNEVFALLSTVGCITVTGKIIGFEIAHCLILAPMIVATGIKLLYRIIGDHDEVGGKLKQTSIATASNFMVSTTGAAAVLLGMSRWLEGDVTGSLMVVMMIALACTVVASFVTKNQYWRTLFRTLILAIVGSSLCVFDGLLDMTGWHRGEICCLVGGVVLIVLGHLAWLREDDADADAVATMSLTTGSLLIAIPLAIGLVFYRVADNPETHWRLFHEIATIAGSLILLGTGMLCRIRSTTVGGAFLMLTFVASLVTLVRIPDQLQNASVAMMVGGGVFLIASILMSIYRDRLVALPNQVKEGEGVFQVLKWR